MLSMRYYFINRIFFKNDSFLIIDRHSAGTHS